MTTHVDKLANYRASAVNWVGGRVTVTDETFEFHANGMNRALVGSHDIVVPLEEIGSIELAGGFMTKKIRVVGRRGEVVVRCYGAAKVVETVGRLIGRA